MTYRLGVHHDPRPLSPNRFRQGEGARMTYKPGEFFNVGHKVMDAPRFRKLSPYAQAAYFAFKRVFNGHNNGNLVMSSCMMAERINCGSHKAAKSIIELINARIIEITCRAQRGDNPKATEYRLLENKCDVTGMRAGAASAPLARRENIE